MLHLNAKPLFQNDIKELSYIFPVDYAVPESKRINRPGSSMLFTLSN